MLENYNPYKLTAISRGGELSKPMKHLLDTGVFDVSQVIIDIGCGKGVDVSILGQQHGLFIMGYDKYNTEYQTDELLHNTYDVVTCNYCFNVIPTRQEHDELLELLKRIGENIYISVRADIKAIKDNWTYIEEYDCWKTSKGSYQRFYTEDMITEYFGEVEYIINDSSLKLFKLI